MEKIERESSIIGSEFWQYSAYVEDEKRWYIECMISTSTMECAEMTSFWFRKQLNPVKNQHTNDGKKRFYAIVDCHMGYLQSDTIGDSNEFFAKK